MESSGQGTSSEGAISLFFAFLFQLNLIFFLSSRFSFVRVTPSLVMGALSSLFVISIATGGSCSLALTSSGRVFSWGNNS